MALTPQSIDELTELVRNGHSDQPLLAVGGQTKPRLSAADQVQFVSMVKLAGLTSYEPSEFTFSGLAGTPVREIAKQLEQHGQYLPFDPMLVESGATLGGTAASGLSGPGRFRFGGIRDFLLGVKLIAGDGTVINAGGRVVKNAAGFDIPKLLVGSLGRLGILCELTFKVFPKPQTRSMVVECDSHQVAAEQMAAAAASTWELDAIDYRPGDRRLYLRLGGPENATRDIGQQIVARFCEHARTLDDHQADQIWREINEFKWATDNAWFVKVPLTIESFLLLQTQLEKISNGIELHVSSAASLGWLAGQSSDDLNKLDEILNTLRLSGLVIRGSNDQASNDRSSNDNMWIGWPRDQRHDQRIKCAMDPPGRFLAVAECDSEQKL